MTAQELRVNLDRIDHECAACSDRLVDALKTHDGVISVATVGNAEVNITYDIDHCSPDCLDAALATASAELHERFAHETVEVSGMDCSSCAQTIERAVNRVDGVTSCSVNFQASSMHLEFERTKSSTPELTRRCVRSLGFQLTNERGEVDENASWFARRRSELFTVASAVLMILAFTLSLVGVPVQVEHALYTIAIIIGGFSIARTGIAALIATRRPDMKLLMTIAVVGAVAIGAWLEAALVVVLFSIGEALEGYAVNRARSSLASLVELVPSTARLRRTSGDGNVFEEVVPVSVVTIGDTVIALPGEQIPADGIVVSGVSAVNQASITGESIPVDKEPGDELFAGTLNGEAQLVITVTSAPGDNTLDRIARAVSDAQAQKAPSERWVDAFAAIYTPAVMFVALAVMLIPMVLGGEPSVWFYRGLAFLLLACPCALVISTPVAVVSALGRASTAGVLVRGGQHLESAAGIRAVCLDKTGTITAGHPIVAEIVAVGQYTQGDVVSQAAAIEAGSDHPLATAVLNHARAGNYLIPVATAVVATRGLGVTGVVDGETIMVGSGRFFADHPDTSTADDLSMALYETGHTVIVVANKTHIVGALGLQDVPRSTSSEAVAELHRVGVERVVVLTGDHRGAAASIASQVGIDDVYAELLPGDKVERLVAIEEQYGSVAMVGDGVNDAPALARASVGVAMGTGGSATAIATADIALIGDDLRKLAGTIGLARWARSVVRQNIGFALSTKAIAAVFALVGFVTLWMAVLVDVGATLLVVANGLRLLRGSPSVGRLRGIPLLFAGVENDGGDH